MKIIFIYDYQAVIFLQRPGTVKEILRSSAEKYKNNCAFIFLDGEGEKTEVSYEQLKNDVDSLAAGLSREYKMKKGEKLAIIGYNCYEWCVSYLACLSAGIVAVPVDRELSGDDIGDMLSFASVKVVLGDERSLKKLNRQKDCAYICFEDGEKGLYPLIKKGEHFKREGFGEEAEIDPDALAVLLFTSGTTGNSKGVMLSNRNLCSDLFLVSANINISEKDRSLSLLPLHHTYEAIALLMMLYRGGSIAFCGGIRYLSRGFQVFSPTVFVTVPLILEKLHGKILSEIESKGLRQKFRLASLMASAVSDDKKKKLFADIHKFFGGRLNKIIVGAAALQAGVAEDFELFGFKIIIGYGLTECSPIIICNSENDRTPDTVGRPLGETEIKIDCPDEKGVGEILVKGPMVMSGYYKNEKATSEVFRDGWFCTGDLGWQDKNGRYRISGRCKNVIVTKNGKNIYPEELEYRLNKNPYISESLVYGEKGDIVSCEVLPDDAAVKARLKKQNPSDEEVKALINEVVRSINRLLPGYKRIKKVTVRKDGFSKTTTHKIKRKY